MTLWQLIRYYQRHRSLPSCLPEEHCNEYRDALDALLCSARDRLTRRRAATLRAVRELRGVL